MAPHSDASDGSLDATRDRIAKLTLSGDKGHITRIPEPKEPHTRDWVVQNVLVPELRSNSKLNSLPFITEDHECFKPARRFRQKWEIAEEPWNNFVRLLCGCALFPVLLLQNPKDHDSEYKKMIECKTLEWVSETLAELELPLEAVPVMDMCPLFSDDDLARKDKQTRERAIEEAYSLTQEILDILRPKTVICCQCVTKDGKKGRYSNYDWMPAQNELARLLSSSVSAAKHQVAVPLDFGDWTLWAIRGFHPAACTYQGWSDRAKIRAAVLRRVFSDMYRPCQSWVRAHTLRNNLQQIDSIFFGQAISKLGLQSLTRPVIGMGNRPDRMVSDLMEIRNKHVAEARSLEIFSDMVDHIEYRN